uniref:Uncharacterized protein n=1 Tax=Hyaloperonospora arabidopsidis (strain Emoy2) TaxID=559515 RepID=M4BM99_HYAAE
MRSSLSLQSLYGNRRSIEQRSTSQEGYLPKKCLQKHPASSRALYRYPVKWAQGRLIFTNSYNFVNNVVKVQRCGSKPQLKWL